MRLLWQERKQHKQEYNRFAQVLGGGEAPVAIGFINLHPRGEQHIARIAILIPTAPTNPHRLPLRPPQPPRLPAAGGTISLEQERQRRRPHELKRYVPANREKPFPARAHEDYVRKLVNLTGLSTSLVKTIAYERNNTFTPGVLGSAEIPTADKFPPELQEYYKGNLTAYSNMFRLRTGRERFAVIIHEMSHFNNPLLINNYGAYGSSANRMQMLRHVKHVAEQSEATGVFLNEYHRSLYNDYTSGKLPKQGWWHETHAILSELSATDRKHLLQVENAQRVILKTHGQEYAMENLVSKKQPDGKWFVSQADQALMTLTGKKSVEELHAHWEHAINEAEKILQINEQNVSNQLNQLQSDCPYEENQES